MIWEYPDLTEPTEDRIYSLAALLLYERWEPAEQTAVERVGTEYICNNRVIAERVLRTAIAIDEHWPTVNQRRLSDALDEHAKRFGMFMPIDSSGCRDPSKRITGRSYLQELAERLPASETVRSDEMEKSTCTIG